MTCRDCSFPGDLKAVGDTCAQCGRRVETVETVEPYGVVTGTHRPAVARVVPVAKGKRGGRQ